MRLNILHPPPAPGDYRGARDLQDLLRHRVVQRLPEGHRVRLVAGADVAAPKRSPLGYAAVVVLSFPGLEVVEECVSTGPLTFPYVPGFLSFREAPVLAGCLAKLKSEPDLFLFDGQGLAHPRGMGLASYMGLMVGRPSIGVAKSRLTGTFDEPGRKRGSHSPLIGEAGDDEGRVIGAVLRTKDDTRPVFVSVGHLVSLKDAIRLTLGCHGGYRIPQPTRLADILVARARRLAESDR